jgi:ribonucleotide reductase alpha subunit/intein/homing endonuclease
MRVKKRDQTFEAISFDKVLRRVRTLSTDLPGVDADEIAQKVCARIYDGVTTSELDELAAQMCATLVTTHPDYGTLAARIIISNHHKNTSPSFSETMSMLYHATDVHGKQNSLISEELWAIVQAHKEKLNSYIDYQRDYGFDYFGFKTLERSYLIKLNGHLAERPQHMWMRVSLGIHGWDIKEALETYDLMSQRFFTHATPTLFNAGTPLGQLASCFVEGTEVFTVNRGIVPIEKVQLGDMVVTHTGNVKKVIQLHQNLLGERSLFEVKAALSPSVKVTGNHRFWSITSEQRKWKQNPSWNAISDLREGDYIAIPKKIGGIHNDVWNMMDVLDKVRGDHIHTYAYTIENDMLQVKTTWSQSGKQYGNKEIINNRNGGKIKKTWNIDEDFAWFLGVWFGDGCVTHRKRRVDSNMHDPSNIQIVSAKENIKLIDKCIRVASEKFGIEGSIQYQKNQNIAQIVWHSKVLAIAFNELFGHGFAGKKLNVRMYNWDKTLVEAFMAGLISADGCVSKDGIVSLQMSNESLMKEVYHLSRSVGLGVSIRKVPRPDDWKYATPYGMSIPKTKSIISNVFKTYTDDRMLRAREHSYTNGSSMMIDGNIFVRITNKEQIIHNLPVYVYTLGIEDDHSYNVEGLVCENCFLMGTHDSVAGMYKNIGDCAMISKYAGGIGVHVSNIRAKGSQIRGTNGISSGVIPMLRVYNDTARHINQAGKRLGSIAIYMEPWHADVEAFLEIRKNQGAEEERCRDLFTAMWIPDLFMERVRDNGDWCLMCPDECRSLADVYGEDFRKLYTQYEADGRYKKKVKAQSIWLSIIKSQIETGTPYLCYKDAANSKSNQKNIGVIKSSNLCSEIVEYSDDKEYATCNLASISLPTFVKLNDDGIYTFDFERLHRISQTVTRNINKVIDRTFYPVPETERSNKRHRPIGIGVQGLADVFAMMRVSFDSPDAAKLNREIFETIYHGAITASMMISKKREELIMELERAETTSERKEEISKHLKLTNEESLLTTHRGAYVTFMGSPASEGKFQFDLWSTNPEGKWDWEVLRRDVQTYGLRNSLLLAPMPTASTSQILGNTECFEPITSNIFQRQTLAGDFTIINKHLVRDLLGLGLWSVDMKNRILAGGGSIQSIEEIPAEIRALYKTAWEIKQKVLIDQAADRGIYVCQSQSLNLFVEDPDIARISNMHMYAWSKGLKTGIYYLRTRPKAKMSAFTLDPSLVSSAAKKKDMDEPDLACRRDDPTCTMCSA